jgi:hypothetical protein
MADWRIPNLPGANVELNKVQEQLFELFDNVKDGLEDTASTVIGNLEPDITTLVSNLNEVMPELPALPDINLQAQLTSLSGLTPGTDQYVKLLADITSKFDSALTDGGYSLPTLVSDAATAITEGLNVSSVVPNFEVDAAGIAEAAERAAAVLHPVAESVAEELATLVENENFVAFIDAVKKRVESFDIGELVPTGNIGPFRIVGDTREIVVSDNQGGAVTIIATGVDEAAAASETITPTTANNSDAGREEFSHANICY